MTSPLAAAPAVSTVGAAPAGLNEAQLLVWKRLEVARIEIAALPPLDPEYLAAERYYTQMRRLNGDD